MNMLGAEVNVIAPKDFNAIGIEKLGVKAFTDMKKGVRWLSYGYDVEITKRKRCKVLFSVEKEYYRFLD